MGKVCQRRKQNQSPHTHLRIGLCGAGWRMRRVDGVDSAKRGRWRTGSLGQGASHSDNQGSRNRPIALIEHDKGYRVGRCHLRAHDKEAVGECTIAASLYQLSWTASRRQRPLRVGLPGHADYYPAMMHDVRAGSSLGCRRIITVVA
jgi:hypothetical protein